MKYPTPLDVKFHWAPWVKCDYTQMEPIQRPINHSHLVYVGSVGDLYRYSSDKRTGIQHCVKQELKLIMNFGIPCSNKYCLNTQGTHHLMNILTHCDLMTLKWWHRAVSTLAQLMVHCLVAKLLTE